MYTYKSKSSDMKERYDKVVPFLVEKNNVVEIKKPPFEEIGKITITYMDKVEGGISFAEDRAKKTTYSTLHTFGYYGIFRPDLAEILSQLPEDVFQKDKVYLSVDLAVPNFCEYTDVVCDKDYYKSSFHRGIVTVYSF